MAVVLPHGALFRKGAEGRIRQKLLGMDLLDAVIGLGPNLFYGTSLAACILVLRQRKVKERRKRVLIIDASRDFNPDQIAALLDRREPNQQRAAPEVATQSALGTRIGNSATLSQSEIDALRAQIQACWNPPVGAENAQDLVVRVRVQFRTDGTLSAEPALMNRGSSPYFQVAAESAMRAVRRCQPYTLPAAKYDIWRDVEVTFDPRDMFGG
jgi:colicin import membrane protein